MMCSHGIEGKYIAGYLRAELRNNEKVARAVNLRIDIINRLNREINDALADPKIRVRLAELGGDPIAGSAADFGKLLAAETEKWGKVVKFSGAKVE